MTRIDPADFNVLSSAFKSIAQEMQDIMLRAAYSSLVREAKDFLGGKSGAVQASMEKQMAKAAENLDFETATILRDRLRAATFIQGSQAINASGLGDADVNQGVLGGI